MDLDTAAFRRARVIFDEVTNQPRAARAAALERLCGSDEGLLQLVKMLLATDAATSSLGGAVLSGPKGPRPAPTALGGYTITSELGCGGMGVVYAATGPDGTPVALKAVHPWLPASARLAFLREAQAMVEVRCAAIPRIRRIFTVEGNELVIAMDFVPGAPLLEATADWSRSEKIGALISIAETVQFAHDHGVIHRDLKPSNVLVTPDGAPRVLDFGIASLRGAHLRNAGTLDYVAPEQLAGAPPSARSDVFGLGMLGIALLDAAPPERTTFAFPDGDSPPPAEVVSGVGLEGILASAVSHDPSNRPASARALARALRQLRQRSRPRSSPHPQPAPIRQALLRRMSDRRPLIGRGAERARIAEWLDSGVQLGVIVGTGGLGKSRLLRTAGHDALTTEGWDGGQWVDLRDAGSLEASLHALASALGLLAIAPREAAALEAWLEDVLQARGRTLYLLDTAESSVTTLGPVLKRWADRTPATFLLASRLRLRLPGAAHLELAPLSERDAQAMFRSCAPEQPTESALRALLPRLGGVPLAIELAAANWQSGLFGTALAQRSHLSAMRACVAASWEPLPPGARQGLAALSLFSSDFSLDDAVAMLGDETIEVLSALRDASLLSLSPRDNETLYRMLNPIRDFARLHEPSASHTQPRYVERMIVRAEALQAHLRGPSPSRLDAMMEANLPDFYHALSLAEGAHLGRLGIALLPLRYRSYAPSVFRRLGRALEARLGTEIPASAEGKHLLAHLIVKSYWSGPREQKAPTLARLRAWGEAHGDHALVFETMCGQSLLLRQQGRRPEGYALLREAADYAGEHGMRYEQSAASTPWVKRIHPNRFAREDFEHLFELLERCGARLDLLSIKTTFAMHHLTRGRYADGIDILRSVLASYEALELSHQASAALNMMADALVEQGCLEEAEEMLARSELLSRETGDRMTLGRCSLGRACIALERGDLEAAQARLDQLRSIWIPSLENTLSIDDYSNILAHASGRLADAAEGYERTWQARQHSDYTHRTRNATHGLLCAHQRGEDTAVWVERLQSVCGLSWEGRQLAAFAARLAPDAGLASAPPAEAPPWSVRMGEVLLRSG